MKFLTKKINIILFLLIILLTVSEVFASDSKIQYTSDSKIQYTRENISNYFLGIISINHDYYNKAFKYLKKVEPIKNRHSQFNNEFIKTLILIEKFKQAFIFSENVWTEDELFFEADLLLGLNSFMKKDYASAEKYFERLNKISRYNLIFDNFIGNVLIAWVKASQGNEEESFRFIEKAGGQRNSQRIRF